MLNPITAQEMFVPVAPPRPIVSPAAIKRTFDLLTALLALFVALPFLALLIVAIVLESPGNPFFVQERLGLDGKRFKLLKLRTMVPDAEKRRAEIEHLNEALPPLFKVRNDPRVTRIGRVLRATSVDELPQLINVIRGEMSVVGPRPRLPYEFRLDAPGIARRLSVKPGLAGLWQVSGRAKLNYDEALRLDLQYIDTCSFWVDLKLIAKTFWVVVTLKGAY
ncbi:MAG TPA: sugar transferase [Candidatus Binatus sp.]|nr:sugar transferase [Candidatus Binatus sp.]